jgi:TRAP-type mannitol/chloroaromatic compound transport system permease small subunit
MLKTADRLESFTRATGLLIAWLTLLMVILTCTVVVQRYLFDAGSIQLQESITFMHAAVFLLAAAYTFAVDGHVRVDVFYSRMNARNQALVNLLGTLLFLMPFCGFLLWSSWDFVSMSWAVQEASPESGGLPYPFPAVMKSFIPVAAALLILQGLAIVLRAGAILLGREQP